MSKYERVFVRFLTAFFFGMAGFLAIGLIFWFYPRTMVKSASTMQTEKPEYAIGERIFVTGETWTNINAETDFNVRLKCNGIKYSYDQINNFTVNKQVAPVKYNFPYAKIPEYIPRGSTCRVEATATYHVQILPLLNKNYVDIFNSNEFQVKE